MIEIIDKMKCSGCAACMNACPKKCIDMKEDKEGFLYPLVDINLCINCGICKKKCPILNIKKERQFEQDGYIVQIKDEIIRRESTSGGAFTAIAKYVISKKGVVFGAAYNEKLEVYHTYVEKEEHLKKFRNSKYVQSIIGSSYKKAKKFLDKGRMVCFSGTPCQIEGLSCYLGKEYNNLITVDVVCHGVPSPLVWRKYLEIQREKYKETFNNIIFRDKYYGYKYSTMTIKNSLDEDIYNMGVESDPMLRAFFSEICERPICHGCLFKKRYRVGDFTIWDCFSVENFNKKMDDDKGTTKLLIHTAKGKRVFENIKNDVRYLKIDADILTEGVNEMIESVKPNPLRLQFMNDLNSITSKELFNKYFPDNIRVKLERNLRIATNKLGIYKFSKNTYISIKNRLFR